MNLRQILKQYPNCRIVAIGRHLQQEKKPGQKPFDWFPEANLVPETKDVAASIRDTYFTDVDIAFGGHSPLRRAKQSRELMAPECNAIMEIEDLGPYDADNNEDTWLFIEGLKDASARGCYLAEPNFLASEGHKVLGAVRNVANNYIADGQIALLITHGPLVECAVAASSDDWPPQYNFGRGDIGVFVFEFGRRNPIAFEFLPVPKVG